MATAEGLDCAQQEQGTVTDSTEKRRIEHADDEDGTFVVREGERLLLVMRNQGGYDATSIDLRILVEWIRENEPSLLESTPQQGKASE